MKLTSIADFWFVLSSKLAVVGEHKIAHLAHPEMRSRIKRWDELAQKAIASLA